MTLWQGGGTLAPCRMPAFCKIAIGLGLGFTGNPLGVASPRDCDVELQRSARLRCMCIDTTTWQQVYKHIVVTRKSQLPF